MYKNFKMVSHVVYGKGCIAELEQILAKQKISDKSWVLFLIDDIFESKGLFERLPIGENDEVLWTSAENEPTTQYVDELTEKAKNIKDNIPSVVIGIGGGTLMDLAKAVSLMLTNPGSSQDYQGWDLIQNPAVFHIGIPTLSGTGSEVSRTTVLTGPKKKLGINSDYTVFDQIILDPDLIKDAPKEQRFYTAMDCYIHCAESLTGTYLNAFSQSCGEKSADLIREVFLTDISREEADEKLMMGSFFGGLSIANSQVGVCHALSYGLTYILKLRHGIGNSIVFNQLDDYYPEYVNEFRQIMDKHQIELPKNVTKNCSDDDFEKMVDIALVLEPLWDNALGKEWKKIMTRDKIRVLLEKM